MTTDPRSAATLCEAARNPDGTFNALKALSWLSDVLSRGHGIPLSEVQRIAADVMAQKRAKASSPAPGGFPASME